MVCGFKRLLSHLLAGRSRGRVAAHALDRPRRTIPAIASAPTTLARVRTGGMAPRCDEQLGGPDLDGVHDGDGADGRAGANRCVEPIDGHSASACGVHRSRRGPRLSMSRAAGRGVGSADIDWATDVTAIDPQAARRRSPRHLDRERRTARSPRRRSACPRAPNVKLERMTSARPGVRSMNIAWRWPFAPTTWVWNVIDSSTIGLKPG